MTTEQELEKVWAELFHLLRSGADEDHPRRVELEAKMHELDPDGIGLLDSIRGDNSW